MEVRIPRSVLRAVLRGLRGVSRPVFAPHVPAAVPRVWLNTVSAVIPPPRAVRMAKGTFAGLPARVAVPNSITKADPGVRRGVLYLHGGGYTVGSSFSHRAVAARIAAGTVATVFVPDYRLAPEHPFPAALDDALACYRALLRAGYPAEGLVLAGDSAGAGLALATATRLRDASEPLPAALGLIAPWTDLTMTEESLRTNAAVAPLLRESWLRYCVSAYCAGEAVERAELSPQRAELAGLPPMVVHDGADDLVASDAQRLTERARAAGVEVVYQSYAGLWHDFELLAGLLAEADDAIAEFCATLRSWLGR